MWTVPEAKDIIRANKAKEHREELVVEGYYSKIMDQKEEARKILGEEGSTTEDDLQMLNKAISNLEMELAAAKMAQESILKGSPIPQELKVIKTRRHKYFMVIGINTAFNSRKRRDSVRDTWMPQGEKRKKLEEEKGIVIRFVIGHGNTRHESTTQDMLLILAVPLLVEFWIDQLKLRTKSMNHVEGYLELSAKTKTYFATAFSLWDAEFYVKVDDDVHVNIATLGNTLARHRLKPRVYIGCMKCGPVLARKGVRYYEPEHWKFGGDGNKYFRHATGQLYAISNELAAYISINQHILHKYVNEDVSLGSWFIGLDVEHIDDRKLCCGTLPDCEWKAQAGNTCVASFDWSCSGICDSVDRIKEVHQRCGENESTIWNAVF
ncbi:probable beta-1,3-galactosyltransferase 2 isoform X3 [Musa acuminata AAA Group]